MEVGPALQPADPISHLVHSVVVGSSFMQFKGKLIDHLTQSFISVDTWFTITLDGRSEWMVEVSLLSL